MGTYAVKKALNSKLHVHLCVGEPTAGLFVRATLLDETGAVLSHQPLPYQGFGIYGEQTLVMPNKPKVTAVLAVYTDNTFTVVDDSFPVVSDVFELDTVEQKIDSLQLTVFDIKPRGFIVTSKVQPQGKIKSLVGAGVIQSKVIETKKIGAVVATDNQISEAVKVNIEIQNEVQNGM